LENKLNQFKGTWRSVSKRKTSFFDIHFFFAKFKLKGFFRKIAAVVSYDFEFLSIEYFMSNVQNKWG